MPIAAVAIAILPLAVGLDAMRQLAFASSDSTVLDPMLPVNAEIAILAVMGVASSSRLVWPSDTSSDSPDVKDA